MEPEEIERRNFAMSLRGYDRDEVDKFMQEVAGLLRDQQRLLESAESNASEAVRQQETAVEEAVAAAIQELPAPEPAPDALQQGADPEAVFRQIGEETSKILIAARSAGEEILATARSDAAELLLNARRESKKVADHSEAERAEAERDLAFLREARALLATQLEDIQRRLGESISRLRNPVEDSALERRKKAQETPPPPKVREAEWASEQNSAAPEVTSERARESDGPRHLTVAPPDSSSEVQIEQQPATPPDAAENAASDAENRSSTDSLEEAATDGATKPRAALSTLLDEIRAEREAGRAQVERALAGDQAPAEQGAEQNSEAHVGTPQETAPVAQTNTYLIARDESLGDKPRITSRRIKRLLQEDQNELLDLLRTKRGRGTAEENMPPQEEQFGRFRRALVESLGSAFEAGWASAGGEGDADPSGAIEGLVRKQLLTPLRTEVQKAVESGLEAGDTSSSIAERAGDIYRVWKGVRTGLLGAGMTYSAFHQGMVAAWKGRGVKQKHWVLSEDEMDCPRDVCKTNEDAGPVAIEDAFASGHIAPPAHGGCTCTISEWSRD
ncbi:MAG TPA: DivIVA domain-containing protein [Actinomycetota bacterium]|nr:DivIVA domain-containing protein [Actinomycetota bacterium]